MRILSLLILLSFIGLLYPASPIIYDQGAGATDGTSLIETGDLTVEIWDAPTGGNLLYSNTFVGAIRNGSWVVELDLPNDFEYGRVYYKDYQIDGNDIDFDGNERLKWMSPLGIINSSWVDNSTVQLRVSGTCPAGYAIESINADGTVNCVSISGSVQIGYNETGDEWLYNDSTGHVLYFNETKFNASVSLLVDDWGFVNETGDLWLNISNHKIVFNESLLNSTIDTRANFTNGTGLWLTGKTFSIMGCSNPNDVLSWDGSEWVCSAVSSLTSDTQKNASTPWLYNDTTTIYFNESHLIIFLNASGYVNESNSSYLLIGNSVIGFNESLLNQTIDDRASALDTQKAGYGPWLYNDTVYIYFNDTLLNATIDIRANYTNGSGLSLVGKEFSVIPCPNANDILQWDGSDWVCVAPSSVTQDTQKNASEPWLYNDSTTIYFNETKFNESVNISVNNYLGDHNYFNQTGSSNLLNSSDNIIDLNETLLNETIDIRANYTNGTGLYLVGKVFSIMACPNANDMLLWDGSKWVCSAVSSVVSDTQKNASGPWLYNDSTTIYFNETHYNKTTNESILAFNWLNGTLGNYLYVLGRDIGFDESVLNSTISSFLTDNNYINDTGSNWLNASNNIIDFNETKLNETIDIRANYTNGSGLSLVGKEFSVIPCPNANDILQWDGSDWVCVAPSSVTQDTQKNASEPWLYNDSTTIYFNETKFNVSVNESINNYLNDNTYFNDTGVSDWLNSTGNVVDFNETKLEEYIDANVNDTQKNASEPWLYNDSTTIYFNETKFNESVNVSINNYLGDNNYINDTGSNWLNTSNNIIDFNETKLNETIDARANYTNGSGLSLVGKEFSVIPCPNANDILQWDGSDWVCVAPSSVTQDTQKNASEPWLYNDSTTIYFNETKFNVSVNESINNYLNDNTYFNDTGVSDWLNSTGNVVDFNETKLEEYINANVEDTQKNASEPWLYNDSTTIYFNESKFNESVNVSVDNYLSDNNYINDTGSNWLNTSNNIIDFNETKLNETIDIRANYTNGSGLSLVGKEFSVIPCPNANDILQWDGSDWVCVAPSSVTQDTQKNASEPWLYNDSTTIYFNETKFNESVNISINNYLGDNNYFNDTGVSDWLNSTGNVVDFNETKLEEYINANVNDTQKNASEPWLYNDSTTIYFNESKFNESVNVSIDNYLADNNYINDTGSNWLNASNNIIDFNETKLNATIDIRANYTNGSGLLLVDMEFSIIPCPNANDILQWDGSDWICTSPSSLDTQKNASEPWLYNDSTTIYFNESKFNESVNESINNYLNDNNYFNDTGVSDWLNSTGNVVDFNETKLEEYLDANVNDTQKNASEPWLYNDSTTIYFNETKFNESVNVSVNNYLVDNNYFNDTGVSDWLNSTGNVVDFNETKLEEYINANVEDTQKNASEPWLYNDSTTIYFNETKFNESVNISVNNYLGDNNYINDTGSNWLNTSNNIIDFNETKLNETIDIRANYTNGSGLLLVDKEFSIIPCPNANDILQWDGNDWICVAQSSIDTQKSADEPWLYNDSTTIYFNETKFNESVNVSVNNYLGDNNYINDTGSDWLNASNNIIDFNETKLNETIDIRANYTNGSGLLLVDKEFSIIPCPNANDILQWDGNDWICTSPSSIDTQKDANQPWLYNDSTTIYFNESKFNESVNVSINNYLGDNNYFNDTGVSDWLNSTGNVVDFNETKLEEYINANVEDTQKNASEPWLYNDSTTIYFNESKFNESVNVSIDNYLVDNNYINDTGSNWLNTSNNIIDFNETKLNETIDIRANYTNGSGLLLVDKEFSIIPCPNANDILQWDGNDWVCVAQSSIDTQKSADEPWLYNDSTTIYFNESKFNESVNVSIDNYLVDNNYINDTGSNWLNTSNNIIDFNETKLNETIDARAKWSNTSTTLYPSDSSLNVGIGTDTANDKLEVNGTVRIDNTNDNTKQARVYVDDDGNLVFEYG